MTPSLPAPAPMTDPDAGTALPLRGISSMATRLVLAELGEAYTRLTGTPVHWTSVGGVDAARRVAEGEVFDLVVLASEAIDKLAAAGHVPPGSRVDLVHSGVAVAVPAGAPRPDIGTEAALREAVRQARSIGHSTGPSGVALARLFAQWGLADEIAPRLLQAPAGVPVGELVARGEIALGFQQLSELIHVAGIDIVGPMPAAVQIDTVFSAAPCRTCSQPEATAGLIRFMASAEAAAAKQRQGMQPA